jgi:hypothetical protein
LKAKVVGFVEYVVVDDKKQEMKKINIKDFELDLLKGQEIVKNHTFTDFWDSVADIER